MTILTNTDTAGKIDSGKITGHDFPTCPGIPQNCGLPLSPRQRELLRDLILVTPVNQHGEFMAAVANVVPIQLPGVGG